MSKNKEKNPAPAPAAPLAPSLPAPDPAAVDRAKNMTIDEWVFTVQMVEAQRDLALRDLNAANLTIYQANKKIEELKKTIESLVIKAGTSDKSKK